MPIAATGGSVLPADAPSASRRLSGRARSLGIELKHYDVGRALTIDNSDIFGCIGVFGNCLFNPQQGSGSTERKGQYATLLSLDLTVTASWSPTLGVNDCRMVRYWVVLDRSPNPTQSYAAGTTIFTGPTGFAGTPKWMWKKALSLGNRFSILCSGLIKLFPKSVVGFDTTIGECQLSAICDTASHFVKLNLPVSFLGDSEESFAVVSNRIVLYATASNDNVIFSWFSRCRFVSSD